MENRNCQNCKKDFEITPDDFGFYEKIKVPPPTWCPKCRAMRRMSHRNFRFLYPRVCAITGEKIFIPTPPESPTPVYSPEYWISDKWDAMDYAQDYDFSKSFFVQFKELLDKVPTSTSLYINMVDSYYCMGLDSKNCYMSFDVGFNEDSAYSVSLQKSRQCFDTINCKTCELCYWSINCTQCYQTYFSRNCTSCVDVWFSQDCVGCTNCFGCTNLRSKSYHIFNQPYSKEDYEQKLKEYDLLSAKNVFELRKKAEVFWDQNPYRFRHGFKDAGCTGDYIYNAAEIRNCFFVNGAKNCAYSQSIIYDPIFDCMDLTSSGVNIELSYEVSGSGEDVSRALFVSDSHNIFDSQYIINCKSLTNCFGCVGLRSKKYCIFNKQYTKEEYNEIIPKIIEQMNTMPYQDPNGRVYKYGEFFPPHMSIFAYNHSQAYEYFAIPKDEAEGMGFNWKIPEARDYPVTLEAKNIPDNIDEVTDSILKEVIACEHDTLQSHTAGCNVDCATAFRITKQELDFHRVTKLPIPRICFNCRHIDRIKWRNTPALYNRKCMCDKKHNNHEGKCQVEFETSYAPDRPEIVYCEKCYQQEVY